MKTENIRLFLQQFTDQQLANFQAGCEDRTVSYMDACQCIRGYAGNNSLAGYEMCDSLLALQAEKEMYRLGAADSTDASRYAMSVKQNEVKDERRCVRLLPLIADEWKRRDTLKAQQPQPEEVATGI
jgi:hypothetical protein